MDYFINTSSSTFTITPDSYFMQTYFKYQIKNGILQLGNKARTIALTINCSKNGSPITMGPFNLNIPANSFVTSNEFISTVTHSVPDSIDPVNNPPTIWTFHFVHKSIGNIIELYVNKQEFLQHAIADPIFYTYTVDGVSPVFSNLAVGGNEKYNLLFSYLYTDTKIIKLRLTSDVPDKSTQEISTIYNYNSFSTLNAVIPIMDQPMLVFESDWKQNPYGLTNYSFEFVDEQNNPIHAQQFNGILHIFK